MTEANALKRQSAIVLSSLAEQQNWQRLWEVEKLSNKMSEMEKESTDKIADLEAQIETLKESTVLEENRSNK